MSNSLGSLINGSGVGGPTIKVNAERRPSQFKNIDTMVNSVCMSLGSKQTELNPFIYIIKPEAPTLQEAVVNRGERTRIICWLERSENYEPTAAEILKSVVPRKEQTLENFRSLPRVYLNPGAYERWAYYDAHCTRIRDGIVAVAHWPFPDRTDLGCFWTVLPTEASKWLDDGGPIAVFGQGITEPKPVAPPTKSGRVFEFD